MLCAAGLGGLHICSISAELAVFLSVCNLLVDVGNPSQCSRFGGARRLAGATATQKRCDKLSTQLRQRTDCILKLAEQCGLLAVNGPGSPQRRSLDSVGWELAAETALENVKRAHKSVPSL